MDSGGQTIPKDFFTIKEIESVVKKSFNKENTEPKYFSRQNLPSLQDFYSFI